MQFVAVKAESFFNEYSKQQTLLVEMFSDIVNVLLSRLSELMLSC